MHSSGALLAYDPAEELVNDLAETEGQANDNDVHDSPLTPDVIGRWIEDAGRISGAISLAPPPPIETLPAPPDEEAPPISQVLPVMRTAAPTPFRVPVWLLGVFIFMFAAGSGLIAAALLR